MKAASQLAILGDRRFAPFFVTQLCTVFNDHFFKSSLTALITFGIAGLSSAQIGRYNAWAQLIFVVPMILAASLSGQLAERMEKAGLMRLVKLFEIAVMLLGAAGFYLKSLPMLMTALALLGLHGIFSSTIKFSMVPQLLESGTLVSGNALLEGSTPFLMLLGSIFGTVLAGSSRAGVIIMVIAVLGYLVSRLILPVPITSPGLKLDWNPFAESLRNLRYVSADRIVVICMLAIGWYWFFGTSVMIQLPVYTKQIIGGNKLVVVLYLFAFAAGTALGTLLCGRWSHQRVELGMLPLAATGMTLVGVELYLAAPVQALSENLDGHLMGVGAVLHTLSGARVLIDFGLLGFFSGIFIVPLYSFVQSKTAASHRSRVIAVTSMFSSVGGFLSSVYCLTLQKNGFTMPQLLLLLAAMNLALSLLVYAIAPEFVARFLAWARGKSGAEERPLTF